MNNMYGSDDYTMIVTWMNQYLETRQKYKSCIELIFSFSVWESGPLVMTAKTTIWKLLAVYGMPMWSNGEFEHGNSMRMEQNGLTWTVVIQWFVTMFQHVPGN